MNLILAIAALCQMTSNKYYHPKDTFDLQTNCHQSYLHCVNVKKITTDSIEAALEKCIMEKK